jgi:hypothetical protein
MFSRKQLWRKTHTPRHRADSKDLDAAEGDGDDDEGRPRNAPSSSSFVSTGKDDRPSPPIKLRSALNLYAMLSESEKASNPRPKDTRSMRFSSTVHICLIPSRDELRQQMVELFWKPEDYVTFKHDAVHELRVYLTANGITAKEAIFQLYQPHEHERVQWTKELEEFLARCSSSSNQSPRSSGEKESETDRESSSTVNEYCSEDDDEPRYGRPDADGLKFFTNIKTDIELNAANGGGEHKGTHLPTKTPNAGQGHGQVWAVQWKPQQHTPAEHK